MFDFNYNKEKANIIQKRCEQYADYISLVTEHTLLTKKMFALSQDMNIDNRVLNATLVCDLILQKSCKNSDDIVPTRRESRAVIFR